MSSQCAELNASANLAVNSSETETPPQVAVDFHYHLRAQREPSVLPRVLEMFALRDLIPHHVICREVVETGAGVEAELLIDVRVRGLEVDHAQHLAQRMRNIVPVQQVALELST
jgi:hypothetical protein